MELNSNPAAVQVQWGLAWLADKPVEVVKGQCFTVRATATTTLVAGSWTNCAISLVEDLPRGRYQLVGMFAWSAGMICARAVFIGGGYRPGVLGASGINIVGDPIFRYGNLGVFGEFEDTDQPTFDVLSSSADTVEEFYLDLIQIRDGAGA